jgi:hypothetical protein
MFLTLKIKDKSITTVTEMKFIKQASKCKVYCEIIQMKLRHFGQTDDSVKADQQFAVQESIDLPF